MEIYEKVLKMLGARVAYWEKATEKDKDNREKYISDIGLRCAYKSAYDLLEYAIKGQDDMLKEFDYYPYEEEE